MKEWEEETPLKRDIQRLDSPDAPPILLKFRLFNRHIVRTNFWKDVKQALSFRMDPSFLPRADYPETPYAILFTVGANFTGFHARFAEVTTGAPGGLPTLYSASTSSRTVESFLIFFVLLPFADVVRDAGMHPSARVHVCERVRQCRCGRHRSTSESSGTCCLSRCLWISLKMEERTQGHERERKECLESCVLFMSKRIRLTSSNPHTLPSRGEDTRLPYQFPDHSHGRNTSSCMYTLFPTADLDIWRLYTCPAYA